MLDPEDELYQDLHQGFLTEGSNGAEALWELLFALILLPIYGIVWLVKRIFFRD